MRLCKGDMLELEHEGRKQVVLVYKFSTGKINMIEHYEVITTERIKSKELKPIQKSVRPLQKAKAVKVTVSPSGKVNRYRLDLA